MFCSSSYTLCWFNKYWSSRISSWVWGSSSKIELLWDPTIGVDRGLLLSRWLSEYTLWIAGSISMNLCSKFGVDRGVILPSDSFERRLLVLLLEEIGVLLDPLGLFEGFLFWMPYSSDTVSDIISWWFSGTAGDGSRRLVPMISRLPLEELYFPSFAFSGTSWESSSFLSPRLKVLFEPD